MEPSGAPWLMTKLGALPEPLTSKSVTLVSELVLVNVTKVSNAVYAPVKPLNVPLHVPSTPLGSSPSVSVSAKSPKASATSAAVNAELAVNVKPPTVTL